MIRSCAVDAVLLSKREIAGVTCTMIHMVDGAWVKHQNRAYWANFTKAIWNLLLKACVLCLLRFSFLALAVIGLMRGGTLHNPNRRAC